MSIISGRSSITRVKVHHEVCYGGMYSMYQNIIMTLVNLSDG